MTVMEALRGARELLVTRGWGQGRFYNSITGCYCSQGAINKVTSGISARVMNAVALNARRAIEAVIPVPLYQWNDDYSRTRTEVLTAFDEAIAAEEKKGDADRLSNV